MTDDKIIMQRAITLAKLGQQTTHPNPRVGCVIVKNGQIVGEGWHERAGEAHAEIHALRAAGDRARGATAYVTLEPCSHFGRTPPCADALINAGIVRVVVAMRDPNPLVCGRGIEKLRAAGISITEAVLAEEAEQLNLGFCQRMRTGKPRLTLKIASSIDGKIAAKNGESQWITGELARQNSHELRANMACILTSIGTVLADNPKLTARNQNLPKHFRQPLRVILDSRARMPHNAACFAENGATQVISGVSLPYFLPERAQNHVLPLNSAGHIDLAKVVQYLGQLAINDVLIEGGSVFVGAWLQSGLIDEIIWYLAPSFLGSDGLNLAELPLQKLQFRQDWRIVRTEKLEPDLKINLLPKN